MKKQIEASDYMTYAFPRITTLVTAMEGDRPNVFAVAWHSPISMAPPLYGISVSPKRHSHDLILQSKEFVINFPCIEIVDKVHMCGRTSGRDADKFALTGLTPVPAEKVRPPLIGECYAHLECRAVRHESLGDHTWFTGEILSVCADEEAFVNGLIGHVRPVYYVGKDTYTTITGERIRQGQKNP